MAVIAVGCAGKVPPSSTVFNDSAPATPKEAAKEAPVKAVEAPPEPPKPALIPDSTGPEVRPSVLVEKNNMQSVRTRLIPRVMGKGWTLSVNKSDSIEFLRNADAELTAMLFRSPPVPASRIRLRFRLESIKEGSKVVAVKITSTAHLVGAAVYPYRPVAQLLEDNLEEMRTELLAAPSVLKPLQEKAPAKKR